MKAWREANPERVTAYNEAAYTPAPARKWCANCGCKIANRRSIKFCTAPDCRRASKREGATARTQERRARLAGVQSERFKSVEVFERDGWICGICDGPVDRALKWPNRMSATLDHVVPLVLNGPHTRANTQLAHWTCNARKGRAIGISAQVASQTQEVA